MQNQTSEQYMDYAADGGRGVGIFVVPDVVSNEVDAVHVVAVQGLSYVECVRRGTRALAFKWVSESDFVKSIADPIPCKGACAQTCDNPTCVCLNGRCVKSAGPTPAGGP